MGIFDFFNKKSIDKTSQWFVVRQKLDTTDNNNFMTLFAENDIVYKNNMMEFGKKLIDFNPDTIAIDENAIKGLIKDAEGVTEKDARVFLAQPLKDKIATEYQESCIAYFYYTLLLMEIIMKRKREKRFLNEEQQSTLVMWVTFNGLDTAQGALRTALNISDNKIIQLHMRSRFNELNIKNDLKFFCITELKVKDVQQLVAESFQNENVSTKEEDK